MLRLAAGCPGEHTHCTGKPSDGGVRGSWRCSKEVGKEEVSGDERAEGKARVLVGIAC